LDPELEVRNPPPPFDEKDKLPHKEKGDVKPRVKKSLEQGR
jgi:hypothetical protein